MTTAGRPTFDPARGGSARGEKSLSALSKQYSSRDLPSHTKLKYRQPGQGTNEETRMRDFRRELEDKERVLYGDRSKRSSASSVSSSGTSKKIRTEALPAATTTSGVADDRDEDLLDPGSESSSDDSDEDETAELLAELNRIKKERAAEEAQKEAEKREAEERIRMENILSGNPLVSASSSKSDFKVKRRWDDDVVFKNCARSEPDKSKVNFVNDTLRSEFHKKFMDKYIK